MFANFEADVQTVEFGQVAAQRQLTYVPSDEVGERVLNQFLEDVGHLDCHLDWENAFFTVMSLFTGVVPLNPKAPNQTLSVGLYDEAGPYFVLRAMGTAGGWQVCCKEIHRFVEGGGAYFPFNDQGFSDLYRYVAQQFARVYAKHPNPKIQEMLDQKRGSLKLTQRFNILPDGR